MRTQVISAKLKLEHNDEQSLVLHDLADAYKGVLNHVSQRVFNDLGKTQSNIKIQKELYQEIRARFPVGAQLTCSACQQVASTYKQLWTTAKKNAHARKSGWTKKRYAGLDHAPVYKANTVTLQYNRDYSWSKDKTVSVATLGTRIKLKYRGWDKHLQYIREGAPTGAAKLWYDRTRKQWYLIVGLEIQRPDVDPVSIKKIRGVDVGQRCLTVTTDTDGKTKFKHGGEVKQRCRHYARVRRGLQSKGTRSATKVLTRLSVRERRFRSDVNHRLAVDLLEQNILVGMEDLTGCRERTLTKRRKARNGASPKQRQATREHSSWAYAELRGLVAYKAFFYDSVVVQVDAKNTSKGCAKCGHVDAGNRPQGSLIFKCTACGHTGHSDKNGADNILIRTLVKRQDLSTTGCLSATPEVPGTDGRMTGAEGQAATSLA